jgi:hypothetical protein
MEKEKRQTDQSVDFLKSGNVQLIAIAAFSVYLSKETGNLTSNSSFTLQYPTNTQRKPTVLYSPPGHRLTLLTFFLVFFSMAKESQKSHCLLGRDAV